MAKTNLAFEDRSLADLIKSQSIAPDSSLLRDIEEFTVRPAEIAALLSGDSTYPFAVPLQNEIGGPPPIPIGPILDHEGNPTRAVWGQYPLRLASHTLALAAYGKGKTSTNRRLALKVHAWAQRNGRRVVQVFLDVKEDYEILRHAPSLQIPGQFRLIVCPSGFSHDPLDPQGMDPPTYYSYFIALFCETFGLLEASEALCRTSLLDYLRSARRPTFRGWIAYMKALPLSYPKDIKKINYRDSIVTRGEGELAVTGRLYDGDATGRIALDSLAPVTVVSLSALSPTSASFLAGIFLLRILLPLITGNKKSNDLLCLILLDEAKLLASPLPQSYLGTSLFSRLFSLAREMGVGFVFADSSTLFNPILYTAGTKLIYQCDGETLEKISRAAGLKREQQDTIRRLKPGQFAVCSSHHAPFVVQAYPTEYLKRLKAQASPVKATSPDRDPRPTCRPDPSPGQETTVPPERRQQPPSGAQNTTDAEESNTNGQAEPKPEKSAFFNPLCQPVLLLIGEKKARIVSDLHRLIAGSTPKAVNAALNELEGLKYLKRVTHKYRRGRGGTAKFIYPLEPFFRHFGLDQSAAVPGPYHDYMEDCVEKSIRDRGGNALKHHRYCDVVEKRPDGTTIGYECTVSFANVAENLLRDFEVNSFDQVVIVVENREGEKKATAIIAEKVHLEHQSKVRVALIDEFLPGEKP